MPASYTSFMVIPTTDHSALTQFSKTRGDCRVAGCRKRVGSCKHYKSGADRVSLLEAEQVLAEIRAKWSAEMGWYHDDMFITSFEHEELPEGSWGIAWEGGPEGWTAEFRSEIPGLYVAAQNHWLVAVHPG